MSASKKVTHRWWWLSVALAIAPAAINVVAFGSVQWISNLWLMHVLAEEVIDATGLIMNVWPTVDVVVGIGLVGALPAFFGLLSLAGKGTKLAAGVVAAIFIGLGVIGIMASGRGMDTNLAHERIPLAVYFVSHFLAGVALMTGIVAGATNSKKPSGIQPSQ